MNYFEDHIGDYAAATAHLTWDEDMAYTRLIRAYYHAERPIPKGQAHRLARATTPAQRRAVDAVIAEFFVLQEDGYHQKRCDEEVARYRDKQMKARRSAGARWEAAHSQSERNANAMPTHCEGNAHQTPEPDSIHQTQEKEKKPRVTAQPPPCPPDVEAKTWGDFMVLRKAKRSPLTGTALQGIRREATKAGLTLEQAITACSEYGWQAFNAGWYADRLSSSSMPGADKPEPEWRREQIARTRAAVPNIAARTRTDPTIIDVGARHVIAATLG